MIKKLTDHKYLTIDGGLRKWRDWFHLSSSFSTKGDHAGFRLYFSIYRLFLEVEFTDNRHWDYESDKFEESK